MSDRSIVHFFSRPGFLVFGILLWSAVNIFLLLGTPSAFQVSEAREGVVVDEILRSGEVVLPLRNGEIVPSKPILFHWIGALAGYFAGSVDEFILRFPSALAACTFLVFFCIILTRSVGGLVGAVAPLLLLSTYGFIRLAQDGRVDMLFSTLTSGSILVWLAARAELLRQNRPPSDMRSHVYVLAAILAGLAVLAKGPLGIVLPVIVVTSVTILHDGVSGLRALVRRETLIALILPLPWYLAAAFEGSKGFIGRQLIFENVSRFFGGEGITEKSHLFYFEHLTSQGAPWIFLLALYLLFLTRGAWSAWREGPKHPDSRNRFLPANPLFRFWITSALVWIASTLLFLTLAAGKRRGYLLPLLPAMTIVLAVRFAATWFRLKELGREGKVFGLLRYEVFTWGLLCWLLVFVFPGMLFAFSESSARVILRSLPELTAFIEALPVALAAGGGWIELWFFSMASLTFALWVYGFLRRSLIACGFSVILYVQWTLFVVTVFHLHVKGVTHSFRDYTAEIRETVPLDIQLKVVKTRLDEHLDGFLFYFKRHVQMVDPKEKVQEPGLYFAHQGWFDQQPRTFRDSARILRVGGRRVDEYHERWLLFTYGAPFESRNLLEHPSPSISENSRMP